MLSRRASLCSSSLLAGFLGLQLNISCNVLPLTSAEGTWYSLGSLWFPSRLDPVVGALQITVRTPVAPRHYSITMDLCRVSGDELGTNPTWLIRVGSTFLLLHESQARVFAIPRGPGVRCCALLSMISGVPVINQVVGLRGRQRRTVSFLSVRWRSKGH